MTVILRPWEAAPTGPAAGLAAQSAQAVPVLTTARLVLRAPRVTDFPTYAEIAAAADGHDPQDRATRDELWLDFAQMAAGWLLRGAGLWSVERQSDGVLVGFLPLNHEHGDPELEIGWFLAAAHRGQGYATEAAQAARSFAFARSGCRRWSAISTPPMPGRLLSPNGSRHGASRSFRMAAWSTAIQDRKAADAPITCIKAA